MGPDLGPNCLQRLSVDDTSVVDKELKEGVCLYSKTCLNQPLKKKTKNWLSRPIIALYRSKVLQNAPREPWSILQYF